MTEQEWLNCPNPHTMIGFLCRGRRTEASKRKLRLFGCACCRAIWPMLTDERSRRAVDATERYVDGMISKSEWEAAGRAASLSLQEWRHGDYDPEEPSEPEEAAL